MPTAVREALTGARQRLRAAGVPSPEHDARLLLAHATGLPPGALSRLDELDAAALARFDDLVARRCARVPLQHLTGRAHFRYLELAVGPGVFVPRPETEVMTGWVVEQLQARAVADLPPVVVDLCTGSGAIAKAVATEVPIAVVHAVEVSTDAAEWARRNLVGTGVELHVEDMADALPELNRRVDVVVANPPYVPLDAYASLAPEVRDHDPALALFSTADGLDAIRTVAAVAARLLRPGGLLAVEHADVQGESAPATVLGTDAFERVRDHRDLTERPRFVTAVRRRGLAGLTE